MGIRIAIAAKHRITRKGISALLSCEADMEVVGEARIGQESVRLAKATAPDVVVIDISIPDMQGIEAIQQVVTGMPGTRIMVLSMRVGEHSVRSIFRAGASGYILKDCSLEELIAGIRVIANGNMYLGQGVADVVIRDYVRRRYSSDPGRDGPLTKREREVLQLLSEGKSSKAIALKLQIGEKTVETHRRRIKSKLGVRSIAGLTKYALREGITSRDY